MADFGELSNGVLYATVGEGPPLVVLPGMARDRPAQTDRDYRLIASPYHFLASATHRRVFAVRRPRGLTRGITMAELVDRQAAALRELFNEPVDVLGISTGGGIALQLAVDHPEVVHKLVVVAAASWLGAQGQVKLRRYAELTTAGKSGASIIASVLAPPLFRPIVALCIRMEERYQRSIDPADMLATIDAEAGFDVTDRLAEIAAPTLVIGGAGDHAFTPQLFRTTAEGIPNGRLILYTNRGHIGTMMDPRFGRDVAVFLAE